jgi:cellulose synthase/poly-beta-1,6-N-acetylglucosamine synthase-like glycosyltransferase
MIVLQLLTTALLCLAAAICAYHLVLAVVGLCGNRRPSPVTPAGERRFAIVVPAHNEETSMGDTLESLAALDYPSEKYDVYVVADNCCDATERIAAAHSVRCLVRCDEQRPGKGQALEWALPQVLGDGADAVVVLDADCRLDRHALTVFDQQLAAGHQVLQANYSVANPDTNGLSYLLAVANCLENELFYAAKSRLSLPVFLRGTGMVFDRLVLERFPWRAGSIVEDVEYSLQLIRAGIPIRFQADVRVISDFPARRDQLSVQRTRWISGNARLGRSAAFPILVEGLRQSNWRIVDAAISTWIISRPLVIAQLAVTLLAALGCLWLLPGTWSNVLVAESTAVLLLYIMYAAAGVYRMGITRRRLGLLWQLPLLTTAYLRLAARALFRAPSTAWLRTPRVKPATTERDEIPSCPSETQERQVEKPAPPVIAKG